MRNKILLMSVLLLMSCGEKWKNPSPKPMSALSAYEGYWAGNLVDLEADPADPESLPRRCEFKRLGVFPSQSANPLNLVRFVWRNTSCADRGQAVIPAETLAEFASFEVMEERGLLRVSGPCKGISCPEGSSFLGISKAFDAEDKIGLLEKDGFTAEGSPIWGQLQLFTREL